MRAALDSPIVEIAQLLGAASLVLSQDGRILQSSQAARDALAPAVQLREGRLAAVAPTQDRQLQAMIARAISAPSSALQPTPAWMPLNRPGRRPLILQALTLPRVARDIFTSAVAVLFIRDPDDEPGSLDPTVLGRLFGLTTAEARVAVAIGLGTAPKAVAQRDGVALSTVRTSWQASL